MEVYRLLWAGNTDKSPPLQRGMCVTHVYVIVISGDNVAGSGMSCAAGVKYCVCRFKVVFCMKETDGLAYQNT